VYPVDVTSLALLLVGTSRLFSMEIFGPAKLALLTLVVSLAVHLAWGAVDFGLQTATDHSRTWIPIISGVVYGATTRDWDRRLPSVFVVTGCSLAVFTIYEISRHGLHPANEFIEVGGKFIDARPVIAMGPLLMLEALIFLFARGRFTFPTLGLALLLVTAIGLVQYRTLWVTTMAAALMGALYLAARYRRSSERVVYSLTAATLIVVPIALFATGQVGTYQSSAESATGDTSTLSWRIDAWKTLIGRHSSPFELILGTPSGTSRDIIVRGQETNLNAHNMFVEALLLYGLVGLLALCALGILALKFRHGTARQLDIAAPAIVILVTCQALVSIAHIPDQLQGLLFGTLLSVACYQPQRSPALRETAVRPGSRQLVMSR
jgi:O-antigen ligase